MAVETKPRERKRGLPELDAEEELDLGRYWQALLGRWWLPIAALVAGAAIGYLLSLGGKQVYQARATIYLGQPLSASGAQIQGPSTNPSAVRQIVFSRWAQQRAERAAALATGTLNGHVSTQPIQGAAPALGRAGQNPLVAIVVTGAKPRRIARAANELAKIAAQRVSGGYVETKIAFLKKQVAAQNAAQQSIDRTIGVLQSSLNARGLSTIERLVIASQLNGQALQRSQVVDQLATYQSQLTLAQTVEQSKVLTPARAVKTTARSRRNSVLVGAAIGLLLGILGALLWDRAARVTRRAPV